MSLGYRIIEYSMTALLGGATFLGEMAGLPESVSADEPPQDAKNPIERHYNTIEDTLDIESYQELSDELKRSGILGTDVTAYNLKMTAGVMEGDVKVREPEPKAYLTEGTLKPQQYHDRMEQFAQMYGRSVEGLDYVLINEEASYKVMLNTFEKATSGER